MLPRSVVPSASGLLHQAKDPEDDLIEVVCSIIPANQLKQQQVY